MGGIPSTAGDGTAMNVLIILGGLMGAVGVTLAAASAHMAAQVKLEPAAYLLLFHASALFGGIAVLDRGLVWRPLGGLALAGFVLGAALFAGDVALRGLAGHRLFPMAAPIGGLILIGSWLAIAVAGVVALAKA
jgi:uncharacterized membrane protein YgdD (TMEM256/DUF423 family)